MFELLQSTRTLAVLCAFSTYDVPPRATQRQLPTLERVESTLERLQSLLSSERFIAAGIQTETLLNHSRSEFLERLETIREALKERPAVNMVVFWSGHGNIHEKSFRLAIRNTFDPIQFEDGIGLDEVLRQSGVRLVGTWTMFLDACYAGEGLEDVVGTAHNLLKSEKGSLHGYGALCSSAPFEKSRDSVFLETVVNVLTNGPSESVRDNAGGMGGGGMFNPHNERLTLSELFNAVSAEYRSEPGKYRGTKPWRILGGDLDPWIFPNPQYQAHRPSRLAEDAYRPIARDADLGSHFFPKALGIDNLESGWHFAGRVEATRSILGWMANPSDRLEDRLYVLVADGGTGKSALLGRLIALADRSYREKAKAQGWNESLDMQAGTVPDPDRIDAALSLRNLSPQTLAEHMAGLLATGPFDSIEAFVAKAAQSYRRKDNAAPCIVLDALDEAQEPSAIVFRIVHPLIQAGWKILVATRRTAKVKGADDLIADLAAIAPFELDRDEQSWNDIYTYSLSRLQHNPLLAPLAERAAELIADRADSKFLFARMATSSLLRKSDEVTLDQLSTLVAKDATQALTQEVTALDDEFKRNFLCEGAGATAMLTALAWSEGDGVPIRDGIWAAMAEAVSSLKGSLLRFEDRHINWLLREAGRFIQEAGDGQQAVYRLFHKSLVDHFQQSPLPSDPFLETFGERIAGALVECVRASRDWAYTNPYLIRHMPAHLALRPDQKGLNNLLLNFDWIQARLNLNGIDALLGDYLLCDSAYPATARLHRTLGMISHILREHPDQLVPQLLGRIAPGVPDISSLLDGKPGANYGLPPPSPEGIDISKRLKLQLPDLNIEHRGVNLIDRTLSLDGFLERARASIRGSRWIPEFGGLSQSSELVCTFKGHQAPVTHVAISSDGKVVVTASADVFTREETVRIWDAQTGLCRNVWRLDYLSTVALSSDGETLALGVSRGIALVSTSMNSSMADPVLLEDVTDYVHTVALNAAGTAVVVCSTNGGLRQLDTRSGRLLQTFEGHKSINCSALSADGSLLVGGDRFGTAVCVWDTRDGRLLHVLSGHESGVTSIALSGDGSVVASGSYDDTIRVWDGKNGKALHKLQGNQSQVRGIAISADGRTMVSGGMDGTVRLWDALTGAHKSTLVGHFGVVGAVAMTPDGYTVVSGGEDCQATLWDVRCNFHLPPQSHNGRVTSISWCRDGTTLATGSADGKVRIWNAQSGELMRTLDLNEDCVKSVAISPDGRIAVSGSYGGKVLIWAVQTGKLLHTLSSEGPPVYTVALGKDCAVVASGSKNGLVHMWDVETGDLLHAFSTEAEIYSIGFSQDGKTLVTAGESTGSISIWDTATGESLGVFAGASPPKKPWYLDGLPKDFERWSQLGHRKGVLATAMSANDHTLYSGSMDGTVCVWDVASQQCQEVLKGHEAQVTCLALSIDGKTLASGSLDRTVRVWELSTGRLLETITFDALVSALAFAEREGQPVMAVAYGAKVIWLDRVSGALTKVTSGL